MRVKLAFGKDGLWMDLPDRNVTVLEPKYIAGLADEKEALRSVLRAPIGTPALHELVQTDDTVAIVFSDITRPQPRDRMLPVLLQEIAHVPRDRIVLINGLGTHRPNTEAELITMLGKDIVANYHIVQHNSFDPSTMVDVGYTSLGHRVSINAEYMRAKVRILTGFIEPHFFAGFSGGPKAVLPGIADQRSVLENHNFELIAHPRATWGVTTGNPLWEEMCEMALMTNPTFLYNVTLNRDKQITGVFAGDLLQAHAAGCEFARSAAMVGVPEPFDIVITSNSGYPLDLNLYQAVKGMSAAAQVVRRGGSILIAAECWDGIPDHGEYKQMLQEASTPAEMIEQIRSYGYVRQDQWEAQVQAQIQLLAEVYVRSTYLDPPTIERALLKPCTSPEATVASLLQRYGDNATICVLPEGPMTIPYVAGQGPAS